MAPPASKLSQRTIATQLKEEHALDLRLAGYTIDVIAVQVGYASRSSGYRAVARAFHRIRAHTDQTAEELRQLEDARYDRMLRAIDAKVQQGDLAAIDRALRISQARRELWGLDAPVQIQTEVSPAMAALLQQWQGLREQPAPQRPALPSGEGDYTDVEVMPIQAIRALGPPTLEDTFAMLDRINGMPKEDNADG